MEKQITPENLCLYAYTNEKVLKNKPGAVVINFHGLGSGGLLQNDDEPAFLYAERDILYVYPYYDPWGWMNRECVAYTDEIADAVFEKYKLAESTPIASTGGSMGGQGALVYSCYAKRTPAVCAALCPVCDLTYHMNERPDLPHTVYHAFRSYEGTLEEAAKTASPLHLIQKMPDIPYMVIHGDADTAVNKQRHSDAFVKELSKSRKVTYIEVAGMRHCAMPRIIEKRMYDFIIGNLLSGT